MDQGINYLVKYRLSFVLDYQSDLDQIFPFMQSSQIILVHIWPLRLKTKVDEESYGTILLGFTTSRRALEYIWKD